MNCTVKKMMPLVALLCCTIAASAQQKPLIEEQYFKNNFKGIVQPLPTPGKWIDDGHVLLTRENKKWIVDAATGSEREATEAEIKLAETAPKPIVLLQAGQVVYKVLGKDTKLTSDSSKKFNPTLSPDGRFVAFTRNNDIYSIEIETGKETRLTTDGSQTILNGYASWVYTEEILGRSSNYRSFWWSPDSKRIAYFRTDDSKVPEFTLTDANTQHGYVEKVRYPKVGDPNPTVKIGFIEPTGGKITFADFNDQDDQYFGIPAWTPDGSKLWVQWINRDQNNLKIYGVNPNDGSKKELYNEQQKTWIQLSDGYDRLYFLPTQNKVLIQSDQTGWNQLYLYDLEGKLLNPVTTGKFTVQSIQYVDEKKGIVYFTARSRENTAHTDVYSVGLNGKNLTRLSVGDYHFTNINFSPNGSFFTTTCSNAATPPKLVLISNKAKLVKELGDSKAEEFHNYSLAKTQMIRVKSDDALYDLPMKVTWPLNMDSTKTYPVLISIYGGPNAGTCWDSWTLGGNQQFYAKEGLIQVVMDHRASGHFGKEGVNYMHRNLGYWEMRDYSTMAKWLIDHGHADPNKIAITGFSYGGYLTCYALTYGSSVFTHGMAGGSVTDWTYYDTHYTERFMDTPADNPEGYKSSSVLNYIDRYKGVLQIVHGVIDDNVHLQNSISLISKLQDAKKEFEFMAYSGGRHGWGGNKGIHFQNLKTSFIYKYLLEKPVHKSMLR